jgi:cellulose synthase/poly-beta-1,6-N-acetylglucosamine synthase-like glycosyltransferase
MVVDNSEGNNDTRKVAQDYGARYLIEPVRGLSRARNRGLAECFTDIVAFLDDDAIPAQEWLGALVAPFSNNKIAAATGKVFPLDVDPTEISPESPITLTNRDRHWFERATFGGMGLGCNMALRRSACLGWNVFDERLGRGAPFHIGEETFALAGVISRGYIATYLPSAVVFHSTHKRYPVEFEARNSLAYWLLLFSEFPGQRMNLLRFLFQRLRGKRLEWPRNPQEPGEIISSTWLVKIKAGWKGLLLFMRTPKSR